MVDGLADRIPAEDEAFDAVVVSGVLCSVADPAAALVEMRRVLPNRDSLAAVEPRRIPHRATAG